MQARVGVRARCVRATLHDQLIDKVLAQEKDLFIIASSIENERIAPRRPVFTRDAPPRQPQRAFMRTVPNRSRKAIAAVATTLRGARVARFLAVRHVAIPFPIPL